MRFEAVLGYKVASNWTVGCNYCYRIQYRINRLKKNKQTNEIILFVLEKQASRQDWGCWTWNGRNTGTRIGIHCINHSLSVVFSFVYLGVAVIHPEVVLFQYLGELVAVRHGVVHSSGLGFLQLKEISKQYLLLHQFLLTPFDLIGYKEGRRLKK